MSRFHNRNFELFEPYDAKVSCTVLRGESIRKDADLLDKIKERGTVSGTALFALCLTGILPGGFT